MGLPVSGSQGEDLGFKIVHRGNDVTVEQATPSHKP